jgi:hypothetical protein
LVVVDRSGLQVVLGHPKRLFDLEQPWVGVDQEFRRPGGAVGAGGEVTYPLFSRPRDNKGYVDVGVMPTGGLFCLVGAVLGLGLSA